MNNKKVCIIGAGIGGLTAGAILSKQGYKVEIFEKESLIGGRAISLDMSSFDSNSYKKILSRFNMSIPFSSPTLEKIFEKNMFNGYQLDLGYHLIGGGIIFNLTDVLSISKQDINILESKLYEQKNGHYDFFVTNIEKLKMLPRILQLLLSGEKTMKKLDKITMTETVKKYGTGKMKVVLEVNSRLITTVNNLDKISTGEVFRTQKDMRLRGVRYPKKGLANITIKLADFIKKNGGAIHLNTTVDKIIIEDKKAKGIVVNNKKHLFDIVVSNILVQNLFKIADEKNFSKEYIRNVKSLYGTGSLCAYYSFKKINSDLIGKSFIFIERGAGVDGKDAVGMIDFMAASPESGLAPKSQYLVQSYIICTPKEAKDKKTLEKLKKILDKNLEKIIPKYKENLNWAIYPAIWHLDGVAKTIDNFKPKIDSPIDNLYLIGDCVKAPGIGINCAINSAQILKEIIKYK